MGCAALLSKPERLLLFALELLCLAGFMLALSSGSLALALACLAIPLQILIWLVAAGRNHSLLLLLVALFPLSGLELLPHQYFAFFLYPMTIGAVALFHFTSSLRSESVVQPGIGRGEGFLLLLLSAWVVLSMVGAYLHGWGTRSLLRHTLVALATFGACWAFAVVPRNLAQLRRLTYTLVAAVVACASLVPFMSGLAGEGDFGGKLVQGPFGIANMNTLGSMMAAGAAIILPAVLGSRRQPHRAVLAAVLVLLLVVLLMSRSRGAWLGFGIAVSYVVIRLRSIWLAAGFAAGAGVVFSLDFFRSTISTRIAETSLSDPSLLGRLLLWHYAIKTGIANWFLGVGMENFRHLKHLYGYPIPKVLTLKFNAHNLYLEFFADLGIVGLVGILLLIGSVVLRLDRFAGRAPEQHRVVLLGLNAGVVAYAVHGLFDALTWHHGAFMLLGVLLGLAICARRLAATEVVEKTQGVGA